MALTKMLITLSLLFFWVTSPVAAEQARTPPPGTKERTQILEAIRNNAGLNVQFIVHSLHVTRGRTGQYAYATVQPSKQEFDGGEFLLKYTKKRRVLWSVTGGGTVDCQSGAAYYQSALLALEADGVNPETLSPQLFAEYKRLGALALEDPDCNAVGDLGPALPQMLVSHRCKTCDVTGIPRSPFAGIPVSRILPDPRFPVPIAAADLDGDSVPDKVTIVHIMPSASGRTIDRDVVLANPWDTALSAQPMPDENTQMALLVINSATGSRYLLHSPYIELSNNLRSRGPFDVANRKSLLAASFWKDCPAVRYDILVMSTEAGIDIALFWNASAHRYDVCWPNEVP